MENTKLTSRIIAWIKSHKKMLIAGLVVLLLVIFLVSRKSAVTAETYTVTKQDVTLGVVLSGRTKSASQVALGFADTGRIAQVSVKEGDRVRAGQTLASLDLSDLLADLRDAEADVVIAESGLASGSVNLEKITSEQNTLVINAKKVLLSSDLEAVPSGTSISAEAPIITGDYRGEEGVYTIRVYPSGAQSGYSFEVSGLENNLSEELTIEQAVQLGTKGLYIRFPDTAGYGNTTWTVNIPNKRSSSYTANYNAYLSALSARDRVITEAKNDVTASGSQESVSQAKISQAQARVQNIKSRIAKRIITAPFDGVVATVGIERGETATATSTISMISDADYEVSVKVPELDIGKLRVKDTAAISLDAYPGETFPGEVISINPAETIIDGVPVYEAKVAFTKKDDRVRSGMTATVRVISAMQPGVIAIPVRFVEESNGETLVTMQEGETTKKIPIVLGLQSSDGLVEVTSGLAQGDVVIAPQK